MNWTYIWAGLLIMVWSEIFILFLCALKKRFIPASDVESAILVAKGLEKEGFTPIINILGEHYTKKTKVDKAVRKYISLIDAIRENNLKAKISVKPTQIGLAVSEEFYFNNLHLLARCAHRQKVPLEIDMESLKYLDGTLRVFLKIPGEFNIRQAVQSYLKRSRRDVGELIARGRRVRLVKGAYSESDLTVDERRGSLEILVEHLLLKGREPAIATIRDKDLIGFLTVFHWENKIEKDKFIFQMLYGISDEIKEALRDLRFRVEVYVPVGLWHKALPYLWRRVKELVKILF
ncbi:MAG: Proline dehydrogenase [Parcubacteria group bacterium GW2011_GWC1_43_11]|nr:MAG: Proline dehydrogenase [Parcubacteria group bacterium GW2011_GWC1_43_11]